MPTESTSTLPKTSDASGEQDFIEGVRISLNPAPVFRRVVAATVDIGIISVGFFVLMFLLGIAFFFLILIGKGSGLLDFMTKQEPLVTGIVTILVSVLILLLMMGASHYYFIYGEYKFGATFGKKLMGLRVVSVDGRRLTKGQAIYRDLVRWYIDGLLFIPAFIAMACTKKRQRVGDILAGTMVVYSAASEDKERSLYVKREDYLALVAHLQPRPVEAQTLDAYLRFANQAFIIGQSVAVAAERAAWVPRVREHLVRTEELKLNDETVLRFFAELCFQQRYEESNQSKK